MIHWEYAAPHGCVQVHSFLWTISNTAITAAAPPAKSSYRARLSARSQWALSPFASDWRRALLGLQASSPVGGLTARALPVVG